MPPRKRPVNDNPTASNSENTRPLENGTPDPNMQNQFQQMMQVMLDQQRQANENQARLQEQMAKRMRTMLEKWPNCKDCKTPPREFPISVN